MFKPSTRTSKLHRISVGLFGIAVSASAAGCLSGDGAGDRMATMGGSASSAERGASVAADNPATDSSPGPNMHNATQPVTPLGPLPAAEVCAQMRADITPVRPRVTFVVDRSTSMIQHGFGDAPTRWDAMRDALLADGGLIQEFEDRASFGMVFYHSQINPGDFGDPGYGATDGCPALADVDAAMGNFEAIAEAYMATEPMPMGDPGHTPTGEALEAVVDELSMNAAAPDADLQPDVLILATDGEPDTCADPHAEMVGRQGLSQEEQPARQHTARELSRAAMERAQGLGIDGYVISVGEGAIAGDHLQELANAGLGSDDAAYWEPGNLGDLERAIRDIIDRNLSCEIALHGEVDRAQACDGRVTLNGEALPCAADNGFEVIDETTIELTGSACELWKSGEPVQIDVTFPCGVFAPE